MSFQVLSPGFLTTVQDAGRFGWQRFGVSPSGAMDWFALRAANRLVDNSPGCAALEFALEGLAVRTEGDCLVAGAGRGYRLRIGGRGIGLWMAAWARGGEVIEVVAEPGGAGGWGYLALAGGVDLPAVLGSRSTYLRAGLGGLSGRALQAADVLPTGSADLKRLKALAGRWLPPAFRPAYADRVTLAVMPGPQADWFDAGSQRSFYASEYTVSAASDRMGYRLEGASLHLNNPSELLSEGMPVGSVQVASGGQPMVMMSDHGTTGGYPKIAVVSTADLPLLAQVSLGSGRVRFRAVGLDEAQGAYRSMIDQIETGMEG